MVKYKNSPPKRERRNLFCVKKIEKTSKKVLTKGNGCDIIVKLSAKRAARSLKIEQQEISAKHCKCEKLNLVKELYILIQK